MPVTILFRAAVAMPIIAVLIVALDEVPQPNEAHIQRLTLAGLCSLIIAALGTLWQTAGGWRS